MRKITLLVYGVTVKTEGTPTPGAPMVPMPTMPNIMAVVVDVIVATECYPNVVM